MALITPSEISSLAREVFIDDSKANRFIDEAEEMDVRPVLGSKMLNYIRENVSTLGDLMNGTTYTFKDLTYTFKGLKTAIAYYAYARLIVGGDIEVTRSGMRSRDSDYSHLDYIKRTEALAAYLERSHRADSQRTKCKIIGD